MEILQPFLCLEKVDKQESVLKAKAFGLIPHHQVFCWKSGRDYSKKGGGGYGGWGACQEVKEN